MVASTGNELLGVGLYSVAEAALYARITTGMMERWLHGDRKGAAVLRPQLANERIVTFLDFIQALAVRAIRLEHHVPLPKIRQAVETSRRDFGVAYPLAMAHTTYLFGDDLVIRLGEDDYVQVSGEASRNRMITKIVEFYMTDVSFDPESRLARKFCLFAWRDFQATMDPEVRFGEPIVATCGYTARALWEAYNAEGSIEAAASAYGVQPLEVEFAIRCYDHLLGKPIFQGD